MLDIRIVDVNLLTRARAVRWAAMPETAELLPTPEQHELLTATLERVNRVSNAVRAAALERHLHEAADLRPLVQAETERARLPATFNRPVVERVATALSRRAGKTQRFTTYQSLTFPPNALKWPGTDRVTVPTASGRRTVAVRVDSTRGSLRPPLEGRPTTLVYRNGELELVAAD
jgi:hypothetical protein